MNIYFESPQRLKIELDATDLSELGITYDELDYRSEHTRQVVNELLSRIGVDEEFGAKCKRIIEIFPRGEDGCTMYFTTVREGSVTVKKRQSTHSVWQTDNAELLFRIAEGLLSRGCKAKISLYLYKGRYRLIINDKTDKSHIAVLSEFAQKCGERYSAMFTAEHARLLSEDLLCDLSFGSSS